MKIRTIGATFGAVAIGAGVALALTAPAQAAWTSPNGLCGTPGEWGDTVAAPTTPTPKAGSIGSAGSDAGESHKTGGTTYTCQSVGAVTAAVVAGVPASGDVAAVVETSHARIEWKWLPSREATPGVTQTCNINVDLSKTKIEGDVIITCIQGADGKGRWTKSGVNQTCSAQVNANQTRIAAGLTFTCAQDAQGNYGWARGKAPVNQTCVADLDLGKTKIVGGVTVTCAEVAGNAQWVAPIGGVCPKGMTGCTVSTLPALGAPCKAGAKPVKIGGKPCSCQEQPATDTQDVVTVWRPVAHTDNLAVTGSNTTAMVGVGVGAVAFGLGALLLIRRRRVRFTA